MKRLVRWWLARQGILVEHVGPDLRAGADIIDSVDDYGRIPQTIRAVANALS